MDSRESAVSDRHEEEEDQVRERWISSVGGVAAPVLAGFSFTAIIAISTDPGRFRWPGLAALALTLSSVFLIVSVQLAKRAEEARLRASSKTATRKQERQADLRYLWMRTAYHFGIIALLLGLGFVLFPKPAAPGHDFLAAASALTFFVCAAESLIIVRGCWQLWFGGTAKRPEVPLGGAGRTAAE